MYRQPAAQPATQITLDDPVNWRSISLQPDPETGGYALIHTILVQEIERFPMLHQALNSFNKAERTIYSQAQEQPNILKCSKSDQETTQNQQRVLKYYYSVPEPVEIITRARNPPELKTLVRGLLDLINWHSDKKIVMSDIRPENIYVSSDGQRIYFGLFGSCLIKDLVSTLQINSTVTSATDKIKAVMKLRPTLAPEMVAQIKGSNSQAAIVYSIGSLLCRVYLKGYPQLQFDLSMEAETNPNLIDYRHIPKTSPPYDRELVDLVNWIDRLVEKDPNRRLKLDQLAQQFGEQRGIMPHPVDFTSLAPGLFRQETPFPAQVLVEHFTSLVQTWKEFVDSLRNELQSLKVADDKLYKLYISSVMLVSAGFVDNLAFLGRSVAQKKLVSGLVEQTKFFADEAVLQRCSLKFESQIRDLNAMIRTFKVDLDQVRSAVTITLCEQQEKRWDSIDHMKKRMFYATIMRCAEYGATLPPNDRDVKNFQKMLFKLFWFICYERVFPIYIGKNHLGDRTRFEWSQAVVAMTHPKEAVLIAELNNFGQKYASQIVKSNEIMSELGATTSANPAGGSSQAQAGIHAGSQFGDPRGQTAGFNQGIGHAPAHGHNNGVANLPATNQALPGYGNRRGNHY